VLSVEEVTLLLQAASAPKYKAAFATAYGAGLRVSEVVALKVGPRRNRRPCAARGWRLPISFIAMAPTGAAPMLAV
jgi:integrase